MRQPVPFGKYLLLDRISVGGMAEVFKAKSYGVEGFEKVIAIKRILPSMGEDADFIKMFIDEAKIAGSLSHANICQIFELGKIDGSHFIAMEYIWGKDLLQIQNRAKRRDVRVPVLMACYIIAKACEGLEHAHKKRDAMGKPAEIVHRDCSPQNILVSYEGEVKIIDFGIARAASRSSRTQAGVLKGKFGYMSPEQVRGLPLDRRSDIFSLGTVLYETLTGERLFVGESDFSTLEKVRNADVARPSDLNPDVPPEVENIVMKALSRDRDRRYQWCQEMQADLQAYLTKQDEVVSNKGLGEAVRSLFMTELAREKEQLERYKRVGRDGLISGVPQAEAKLEVDEELGEAAPLEGDPTILGGPDFDAMFGIGREKAAVAETEIAPAGEKRASGALDTSAYSSDFEENPTSIFSDDDERVGPSGPRAPAASSPGFAPSPASGPAPAPTMLGQGAAGALSPRSMQPSMQPTLMQPLAMQPTAMQPAVQPPAGGPVARPPYGPPSGAPVGTPQGGAPHLAYPQAYSYERPVQMIAVPPRRRDRSYAVRDIAIGVGIAAVVLTIFAVGRFLLANGDGDASTAVPEAATQGSIEIAITGAAFADVRLDGEAAGKASAGTPLILTAATGAHRLVVSAAGMAPCEQDVSVTEGASAAVNCALALDAEVAIDAGVVAVVDAASAALADGSEQAADEDDDDRAKLSREKEKEREKAKEKEKEREKAKEKEKEREKAKEKEREQEKEKEALAGEKGYLVANSSPFARVVVDGSNTGKMTPMGDGEKIALKPGRHSVTLIVGSKSYKYGVTIKAGEITRFYRQLPVDKDKTAPENDEEPDED